MNQGPLLELIPNDQMSARQKALVPAQYKNRLPMYKLVREVQHLDDFDWETYGNAIIWLENGTIMCLYRAGSFDEEHDACFMINHVENLKKYFLDCVIHGETEASILETVTFLWSLKQLEGSKTLLTTSEYAVDNVDYSFNFATLQPQQLARILNANPTRRFFLRRGVWNAEKSVVLATRPNTLNLYLEEAGFSNVAFAFQDGGTVFVRELEQRQSSFGSLNFIMDQDKIPFSRANFERLFELDVFDKLEIGFLNRELALLPFSAKAKALSYKIDAKTVKPNDFNALQIVTKDLQLKIYMHGVRGEWDALPIAFLNRMAELDHFERLSFLVFRRSSDVARVANTLTRAMSANPKLNYLNLGATIYDDSTSCVDWSSHLQTLSRAMEVHEGLRTVVVGNYPPEDDPENFSWLEQLLSRNRNLTVLDSSGNKITNGASIDKLYALNAFHNRSAKLVKELGSVRPSLVGTILVENVSGNLLYTAVLLAHHADVLCERLQEIIEEHDGAQSVAME